MENVEKVPAIAKAAQRQAERDAELSECVQELTALMERYAATFSVVRLVKVGPDGVERSSFQVDIVGR